MYGYWNDLYWFGFVIFLLVWCCLKFFLWGLMFWVSGGSDVEGIGVFGVCCEVWFCCFLSDVFSIGMYIEFWMVGIGWLFVGWWYCEVFWVFLVYRCFVLDGCFWRVIEDMFL